MLICYLAFNALLYAAFSLWCIIAPQQTSTFLGLVPSGPAGESEYLAVYGGLQAGLAVFYTAAAVMPEHRRSAVLLSLALYAGIVGLRTLAGLQLGFSELGNARYAYGLEIALLLAAIILVMRKGSGIRGAD
ncbi:MAG: DUF4345 family protein [Planctomycetes bacterium]|jgi:hypothetical protein|nr:DUF4345 family protein [Planctomycetota bacterium]